MRALLVHWNREELEEREARLTAAGCSDVRGFWEEGSAPVRAAQQDVPDVVVVDLSRLPSHGREVAQAVCDRKATRGTPVVFVDGAAEKVARAKAQFAEAEFCTWRGIRGALQRANKKWANKKRKSAEAVAPKTRRATNPATTPAGSSAGYSGTPLPKKLGIRTGHTLMLIGAPEEFDATLGTLPEGVTIRRRAAGAADVVVCFATRATEIERRVDAFDGLLQDGGQLWLAWPKKTSGVTTDLDGAAIRALGQAAGLVDTKVCAIDATWSGHRFSRRRT